MMSLPYVLDLIGTFVFALSGAMAGVKNKLDIFGVLVLSFAAANTGGIIRDVLIGAVPPGAISDWHYLGRFSRCRTRHLLFYVRNCAPIESDSFVRCGRTCAFCGLRSAQGAAPRTEPGHGHFAGYVDRDRRRYGTRYSIGRDPHRAPGRPICCGGSGGCGDRGDRKRVATAVWPSDAGRGGALLRTPRRRDQASLASTCRRYLRSVSSPVLFERSRARGSRRAVGTPFRGQLGCKSARPRNDARLDTASVCQCLQRISFDPYRINTCDLRSRIAVNGNFYCRPWRMLEM